MTNQYLKDHLIRSLQKGVRKDARKLEEFRDFTIERGVSSTAHGSARVRAGKAEIIAGVKIDTGTPYPDTPDAGSLMVATEMTALSHRKFEPGPPRMNSIEPARVIDRTIRESETINTKELCIEVGSKIWMVIIDITPIAYDGNMLDLGAIAALAALQDARFPELDEHGNVTDTLSDKKLPLDKLPVAITVYKYGDTLLVDPTEEEEIHADARLTIATIDDGRLCALQKGGEESLNIKEIEKMFELSKKIGSNIREQLKQ